MALLKNILAASVVISTVFVAAEATTHNTHRKEHVTIHCSPAQVHNVCPEGYRCSAEYRICEKPVLVKSGAHHVQHVAHGHTPVPTAHVEAHHTSRSQAILHTAPAHSAHIPSPIAHADPTKKPTETPRARAMHVVAAAEPTTTKAALPKAAFTTPTTLVPHSSHYSAVSTHSAHIPSPIAHADPTRKPTEALRARAMHVVAAAEAATTETALLPKAAVTPTTPATPLHSSAVSTTTASTVAAHNKRPAATPYVEIVGNGTSRTAVSTPKPDQLEATPIANTSGLSPAILAIIISSAVVVAIAIFVIIFLCVRRQCGKMKNGKAQGFANEEGNLTNPLVFNDKLNNAQLGPHRKQSLKKSNPAHRNAMAGNDNDSFSSSASSSGSNSPVETREYIVKASGEAVQVQVVPASGRISPPTRPPKSPRTIAAYDPNSAEYALESAASV